MKKVVLLTLHGMGEERRDYAAHLCDALRVRLGQDWGAVSLQTVHYQDVLQGNQERVFAKMASKVHWDELRKFLLFGFCDASSLESSRGDKYGVYREAQERIMSALETSLAELGDRLDAPVVAIAQSLGGQVLSNYIYDYQKAKGDHPVHSERRPAVRKFLGLATLRTFITTGCNIPLFVAGYPEERVEAINPAFLPAPFRWINFYDKDDVLGWPLRPLMGGYETLVEDREIQAGQGLSKILASWNPYSHTQYWKTDAVVDAVETALREAMTAGSPPHALPSAEGTAERNA